MRQFLVVLVVGLACCLGVAAGPGASQTQTGPSAELAAIARSVPAGQWHLIPSPASAALYKQNEIGATTFGVVGPSSVVTAWNGAAYDPARRELHLHGGGHADYGGNEMLTFSFDTLQWRRSIETYDLPARTAARPCPQPARGHHHFGVSGLSGKFPSAKRCHAGSCRAREGSHANSRRAGAKGSDNK